MDLITLSKSDTFPSIQIIKKYIGLNSSYLPAHRHSNFYEFEFIISGSCIYCINETTVNASEGFLFLSTPLDIHSIDFPKDEVLIYNISFPETAILQEYQNILFNTQIRFAYLQNTEKTVTLFELLLDEYEKKSDHFTENNECYLLNLITAEFIRAAKLDDSPQRLSLIQNIVSYIRIHISEPLTLESVAQSFNISPQHLSRIFKKHTGKGFKQYILNLRLGMAKNFLTRTDMPITQICYDSGFSSVGNFLRRFKEKYGAAPTAYRKNHKK